MIISTRAMNTAATLERHRVQQNAFEEPDQSEKGHYDLCQSLFKLAGRFNFSPKVQKQLMAPYERLLANDPDMWP